MRRILLISVLVVGVAVAVALGSYSAVTGTGPVDDAVDAVFGSDEGEDGDVVENVDDATSNDVDDDAVGGRKDNEDHREVVGDVIECVSGEDTQFVSKTGKQKFELTGQLMSLELGTGAVELEGPEGLLTDPVTLAGKVKIRGDLTSLPGPVKVKGKVQPDGSLQVRQIRPACADTPIDCPAPAGGKRFSLHLHDGKFKLTGLLKDAGPPDTGTMVTVTALTGDVEVEVAADAEITGDLGAAGTPVKVKGTVEDGSFLVPEIKAACGDDDDNGDGEDEDDNGGEG